MASKVKIAGIVLFIIGAIIIILSHFLFWNNFNWVNLGSVALMIAGLFMYIASSKKLLDENWFLIIPIRNGSQLRAVSYLRMFVFFEGDNIAVVHKCFLPVLSVILTKRSVGRISCRDLARDVCEMFDFCPCGRRPLVHFVQHDKLCFGQHLYYCLFEFITV